MWPLLKVQIKVMSGICDVPPHLILATGDFSTRLTEPTAITHWHKHKILSGLGLCHIISSMMILIQMYCCYGDAMHSCRLARNNETSPDMSDSKTFWWQFRTYKGSHFNNLAQKRSRFLNYARKLFPALVGTKSFQRLKRGEKKGSTPSSTTRLWRRRH